MKMHKFISYSIINACMVGMTLSLPSCTEDLLGEKGGMAANGTVLSAYKEKVVSRALTPGEDGDYFDDGTKYRIWITQQGTTRPDAETEESGIEAAEEIRGNLHYINLGRYVEGEKNFYGFTRGTEAVPEGKKVNEDYQIELQSDDDYIDYMRGELKSPYKNEDYAQGNILQMPFIHIMSQVRFVVSKANDVETSIQLVKIEMIGKQEGDSYSGITKSGKYQVYNNMFTFDAELAPRTIEKVMEVKESDGTVSDTEDNDYEVGTRLIFPTFASEEASSQDVPQTYLKVTFKDEKDFYNCKESDGENSSIIIPIDENGESGHPLKFKQNYSYTLHIHFTSDRRRVATLVPKVYEWIEGETEKEDDEIGYFQEQDMGQPVTFNGVLWSDRNLGATSGNPTRSVEDWYASVGYLYQYGRNIPYYPYNYTNGNIDYSTPASIALGRNGRKVYPVVDVASWGDNPVLNLVDDKSANYKNLIWNLETAQESGSNRNLGYYKGRTPNRYRLSYLKGYDNEWEKNTKTPCPPGWRLPTTQDFMGILPSSGFAGNITFRLISSINAGTGSWDCGNDGEYDYETTPDNIKKLEELTDFREGHKGELVYDGFYPYLFREEKENILDGRVSRGVYILSMGEGDKVTVQDVNQSLKKDYRFHWGVIYGIKNQGTDKAYRIKWNIQLVTNEEPTVAWSDEYKEYIQTYMNDRYPFRGLLVISRYETSPSDDFEADEDGKYEKAVKQYDWEHPVEVMYLPIGGYCDAETSQGAVNNIGTEVWYATSEANTENRSEDDQRKKIVWIKYAGSSTANSQAIAFSDLSRLGAAVYVRCVRDLYNTGNN